ncbi:MAG: iron-containing alcohol dehydrogenase [Synergistaceae bacterium]|jgi:3-deoxy-alpha-D-manno-octulosonate 8-oxidase|nr:iron-containing alcohol dehydrogenase [Synergistaceae bacterium]
MTDLHKMPKEPKMPKNIEEFAKSKRWWRTEIQTEVVASRDGVSEILKLLAMKKERPFFVIDDALAGQPAFGPLLEREGKFLFAASVSEPRTCDVDALVELIRSLKNAPDVLVGVGGGGTMDLAKAAGICAANPKTAAEYQGYGLDMKRGTDIWVLPTLTGTGAELTPIAVLRGPEKKLGINNNHAAPSVAVIDPALTKGAKKLNRFYTMMDCFFHHYEITKSKTSAEEAIADAREGLALAGEVLSSDLSSYCEERAVKSAVASVLGGSSSIGGRVGVAHAISYGLSNAAPKLPHSVAVTISMLACADIYGDGGYADTVRFLEINGMPRPKASDYGIDPSCVGKMTATALGMEKLWQSHYGEDWRNTVDEKFIQEIYKGIVAS